MSRKNGITVAITPGGGGTLRMKGVGMLVVSLRGGNMYLHSAELNVVAVTENVNTFLLV